MMSRSTSRPFIGSWLMFSYRHLFLAFSPSSLHRFTISLLSQVVHVSAAPAFSFISYSLSFVTSSPVTKPFLSTHHFRARRLIFLSFLWDPTSNLAVNFDVQRCLEMHSPHMSLTRFYPFCAHIPISMTPLTRLYIALHRSPLSASPCRSSERAF
ncbi:hypothetical protein BJ165DRAFT_870887 [Panaeolus papilionaceus]|nr:hypothetical protein BJ165DRAFT_870887 [Panaeolus papilionaceus]